MAKTDKFPRIYLWFTSTRHGNHCNTIGKSASAIAREMVEVLEDFYGKVIIGKENASEGERILAIYERISKLKKGGDNTYIDFENESWSTITLIDLDSLQNVLRILGGKQNILIDMKSLLPEVKQIKKKSRKQS